MFQSVKNLIIPPHFHDEEQNRIAGILYVSAIAIFIGLSALVIYRLLFGQIDLLLPLFVMCIIVFTSIILVRRGLVIWSASLLSWTVLGFLNYMIIHNDGIHDTAVLALPGILVLAGLVLKKRYFLVFTFISLLSIVIIGSLEINGIIRNAYYGKIEGSDILDVVVILGLTTLTIRLLADNLIKNLALARKNEKEIRGQANQLKESEQSYRALFEGANDAILIMNGEQFLQCNNMTLKLFGCEVASDIVGHSPWEFSPHRQPDGRDSKDKATEVIQAALHGIPQRFYWKHSRRDGSLFDAEVSLSSVESGNEMLIQALVRDVSERKQAEDKIRLLAQTLASTKDCVTIADLEDKIIFVNDAFLLTYGYTREELMGHPISIVRSSDTSLKVGNLVLSGTLADGWYGEILNRRKDGSDFPVELWTSVVKDDSGKVVATVGVAREITQRKRVEQKLQESEMRFRTLSSMASEGIIIHEEGVIMDMNQAFAELVGSSNPDDLIGKKGLEIIPFTPESLKRILDHQRRGSTDTYEVELVKSDGSVLPAETKGKEIIYRGHQARLIFMRDITERKQAEQKLRKSEERYRSLFDDVPIGLYRTTPSGQILELNLAACKMLGYEDTKEVIVHNAGDFWLDPEARIQMASMKDQNGMFDLEIQMRRRDQKIIWVHNRGWAARDSQNQILYFEGSLEDITERKNTEEALQASEELYRKLITAIPDVILRTDLEGNIIFVNETAIPSLGYANIDRILGKNIFSFIAEQDKTRALENIKKMFDGFRNAQEYSLIGDNGIQVDFEVNGDVLRHNDGTPFGMVYIVRDLTEKKKLQAQFLQSQKMDAIGKLAGGVAHDYNNMIGVILGYATMLEKEISIKEPAHRKIKSIIAAAERSANLTRQLLAFSRQQIIAPIVLNLNDEMTTLKRLLGRLIGEDIKLVVLQQEQLWNVKIDPTQFTQIVTNLATNARDAIVNTGTIEINTENVKVDESMISAQSDIVPGEYVMLSFRDSGCGMDAATQSQIFEPFFTTKPVDKGTGLGLSTVFGIVKQNNGCINVDSRVGQGTTFKIYFPRHIGELDFLSEDEAEMDFSGKETILVVEDEEELLELTKGALEAYGYKVLGALAPAEAIDMLEMCSERIDLLITDVVMPGMNGKELKERLDGKYPSLKTLFISGYTSDIVAKRGVLEEGMHFLQKPFTPVALLKKVRQTIQAA